MRLNLARMLIGLVILVNLQAAVVFLLWPEVYAPGFELLSIMGVEVVRSWGILFIMWNVPYAVALWNPVRYRISLYEALAMQVIGLTGEILIFISLPITFSLARASILRFIAFDALSLLALIVAALITRKLTDI